MANKMAEWRLNRKIFTHRQKMMLAAKANGRFLQECERLNEELSQSREDPTNVDFNDQSNDVSISLNDTLNGTNSSPGNRLQIHPVDSLFATQFQDAEKSDTPEDEPNVSNTSPSSFIRPVEKIDISAALVAIKTRHSLSAVCINDICSLLCILNVQDAPRTWFQVKTTLNSLHTSSFEQKQKWICPNCKKASDNIFLCSNNNCNWHFTPPSPMPNYFYVFNIIEQLTSILATASDLILPARRSSSHVMLRMSDIVDGSCYHKLLNGESSPFITLTMSTDGIQPFNSSEKSIWPVTFVINEIKQKRRFSFQNLILGGVWPGPKKPKRSEMTAFLETIVVQLKELENGFNFECRSNTGYVNRYLKVFLICACMDKPAQSLVQNLPEPTAIYGCGRCEIRGYSTQSSPNSNHYVNCFPIDNSFNQIHLRSNDRYDQLILIKELNDLEIENMTNRPLNRKSKSKLKKKLLKNRESERGILGRCVFRELKYFDVGFSFVSDNLHNVYQGVFRKLLTLWLRKDFKEQAWSCYNYTHHLSSLLRSFRFPSTTARRPRSLTKYKKLKASELRMILLFGFIAFKNVLKDRFYNHFLKLVVAIHLSEFRAITVDMRKNIKTLLDEFLMEFPQLYTARHNQQVIHSLYHIGQTVNDYGPLTSYSTFHFENILGVIMRTIKGTRREEIEMIGNLNMFRNACVHLNDLTMDINFKNYIEKIISGRGYYISTKNLIETIHPLPPITRITKNFPHQNLRFFSTCKIGHIRYTCFQYSKSKVADDSAIIFKLEDEFRFGLIVSIFSDEDNEILFEVWPLSNAQKLNIFLNGQDIELSSIQEGKLEKNNYYYITSNDIIEKCVYWRQKSNKAFFFRFPNLEQGS